MLITPMGDSALIVEVGLAADEVTLDRVLQVARTLGTAPLAGVTDIVSSFTTVAVHYEMAQVPPGAGAPIARVAAWVQTVCAKLKGGKVQLGQVVEVPVCYGGIFGPDLGEVARRVGLSEEDVVRLHSNVRYRVAAVGFVPGFPYLLGLPAALRMPRRANPRVNVPPGSVGIGGGQTGVYPMSTPGGWQLIGRTSVRLFRPESEAPSLVAPGDTVRFISIPAEKWKEETGPDAGPAASPHPEGARASADPAAQVVEVVRPGALTTIQDLGRPGWQRFGVPRGGAVDQQAARIANLLVGNSENAPVLEGALTGPELWFHQDTWVAVTGAAVRGVPGWRPLLIGAGERLRLAELTQGARVYVAVAGGFQVPRILGGAGTMLRAKVGGFHGRSLAVGDQLMIGVPERIGKGTARNWAVAREFWTPGGREITVRFVRGRQWTWFDEAGRATFKREAFRVTMQSDRMGLRLGGSPVTLSHAAEMVSEGVVFGTVQVPPNGHPIVLLGDRQTLGGYPKIGHVITVDLPRLAQARPGDLVRFAEIPIAEAQALAIQQEADLHLLRLGIEAKMKF
jgi:KipI family sensor histidine kinase inhibitor